MINPPKAILFDFDGVVVDSFEVHYGAWKQAFTQLFDQDILPFPKDTHSGKSPMLIASYFCEAIGQSSKTSDLFQRKGELLHSSTIPPKLLPGVPEITGFLTSKALPFGIASNATRAFIKNSIQQLHLEFDTYFGIEDYKNPKPHPEPYQLLASALGISASAYKDVIVFEDSITGIKAVCAAGMKAIGITTQYTAQELLEAGCTRTFPSLLEACQWLEKEFALK